MKTQKQHDQDGGPAYPATIHTEDNSGTHYEDHPGMTLRDWFAGQALPALEKTELSIAMAAHLLGIDDASYRSEIHWPKVMAKLAYGLADAMLAERNKPLNEPEQPAV